MTRVRLTLEVDSQFVRFLKAQVGLSGTLDKDKLTAKDVLAVVVLGEAMGAHYEQTYLKIPNEWRGNIDVVAAERRTLKDGEKEWRQTKE